MGDALQPFAPPRVVTYIRTHDAVARLRENLKAEQARAQRAACCFVG